MPITDSFAVKQALANIQLENCVVDDELRALLARGLNGELTTTEIIAILVNG
jgi:hypothetical protein